VARFLYYGGMTKIMPVIDVADALYVTRPLVDLWRKKGWVKTYRIKHPVTGRECNGVDLDEAIYISGTKKRERESENFPPGYITYQQATKMLYMTSKMVGYYVKQGYLTPYYFYENKKYYALKESEGLAIPDRLKETRQAVSEWMKMREPTLPRDDRGKYTSEQKND